MSATPAARAARHLSVPGLEPLVAKLHARLGASTRTVATVTVTFEESGRNAYADLLGLTRMPPATVQVTVAKVAAALGVDETGLRAVVEAIAGPLGNRAADLAQARAELAEADASVAALAEPLGVGVVEWARNVLRSLPGPVSQRRSDIEAVLAVVATARSEPVPVPVAAAKHFGDPHALDSDRRIGELVAGAAAAATSRDIPRSARARREALAAVGLLADELSSTVATWGLVPQRAHPQHQSAQAMTAAGEPLVWTLSALQHWPVTTALGRVLVVENPSILTTAAHRRFDGVVVCSAGVPSVAATTLVEQLHSGGTHVDVHADFDAAGLGIVGGLSASGRAHAWHMGSDDYLAVVERSSGLVDSRPVPPTLWDPAMAELFAANRLVVFEEQIIDHILT